MWSEAMDLESNLGWKGSFEVIWYKSHSRQRQLQSSIRLLIALSGISSNRYSTVSLVYLFLCVTNLIVKVCSASSWCAVPLGESHANSHQEGQYLTCKEADFSCFCIRLMIMPVDHTLPFPMQLSSVEFFKSRSSFLEYSVILGEGQGRGGWELRGRRPFCFSSLAD